MRLEPLAKPIRIRIKLGDSEFSSLEDVKNNFSIKELYPLFQDGRLGRWLMQIGEKTLAEKISEKASSCSTDGTFIDYAMFLSTFFGESVMPEANASLADDELISSIISDWPIKSIKRLITSVETYDMSDILRKIKSKDRLLLLFKQECFHGDICNERQWGILLASIVKDDESYKALFQVIDERLYEHPDSIDTLNNFVDYSLKIGYRLETMLNEVMPIDKMLHIYDIFKEIDVEKGWGFWLASKIKDWQAEHTKVLQHLSGNDALLDSFYHYCIASGIVEAQNANSNLLFLDRIKVRKFLRESRECVYDFSPFAVLDLKQNLSKCSFKTEAGRQFRDFIICVFDNSFSLKTIPVCSGENFFGEEYEVMNKVSSYTGKGVYEYRIHATLQKLSDKGNKCAQAILTKSMYNSADVFMFILEHIQGKLDKKVVNIC